MAEQIRKFIDNARAMMVQRRRRVKHADERALTPTEIRPTWQMREDFVRAQGLQKHAEGDRVYLLGDTYPVRTALCAMHCRWDPVWRAWWTADSELADRLCLPLIQDGSQGASA